MARQRGKAVDKWKQKIKYKILAPKSYEYRVLGTTMAMEPKLLKGRRIGVSMRDITGDKTKQHQNLIFELTETDGKSVHTQFKKYLVARRYLGSMVRENMSKIDFVDNVSLSDAKMHIKIIVITRGHAKATQKKAIIKKINQQLNKHGEDSLDNFVHHAITAGLGKELNLKIKNICPIGRVEVAQVAVV